MKRKTRQKKRRPSQAIPYATAVAMLAAGTTMAYLGFYAPPVGEISRSALWFFSQCLLYAGGIFGIGTYVKEKMNE